jgi:protein-L-isoaspartate(D-aspartate) O-methyltransferase
MLVEGGTLHTLSIIEAFRKVPREKFMQDKYKQYAYHNEPFPIGHGQTISQPLTIAAMTEALEPGSGMKILEIGTGSGYQAAILAEIVGKEGKIITIERISDLVAFASKNIASIGYENIHIVQADGTNGFIEEAPYDRIIVTANAPDLPQPLINQLKIGGKMVIPVKEVLVLVERNGKDKIKITSLGFYAFVPLIGEYGYDENSQK